MNAKIPKFILTIITGLTLLTIASVADCDRVMNISAHRGVIEFNSSMLVRDVDITNSGNCNLNIHDIYVHESIEDEFTFNPSILTIAPNSSETIEVTYTGDPSRDRNGNIYFPSDKTGGKSDKLLRYTNTNSCLKTIEVDPTELDIEDTGNITIENTSTCDIESNDIHYVLEDSIKDKVIINSINFITIPAGDNFEIGVTCLDTNITGRIYFLINGITVGVAKNTLITCI